MQRNSNLDYAGDLTMELEEIEKLIPKEEQVEGAYTNTLISQGIIPRSSAA